MALAVGRSARARARTACAPARGTAMTELQAMKPRASQYNPGLEVPERSWAYRLAKKIAFHEYGVYTKHFDAEKWQDTRTPDDPPNVPDLESLRLRLHEAVDFEINLEL